MRRVAAVALRSLLVELARERAPETEGEPLAVVFFSNEERGESDILGNTRIAAVSPEAWALGVRPTMTVASARARVSDLRVRAVSAGLVRATLLSLAESCLRFGATVAVQLGARWHDDECVWVDVTGCAHLHGETALEGERALAEALAAHVSSRGHACQVAIASGPRLAAAFARHAHGKDGAIVVPREREREALSRLTVRALPLGDETASWLENLGLARVEALSRLPRAQLGSRLGRDATDVMMLLDGDDRAPLVPHVPAVAPQESATLEYAIEHTEAIVFVCKTLCDRLGARLEGRGQGAIALSLVLGYDRAFVSNDERAATVRLVLPSPLSSSAELLSVLRARVDALGHQALVRAPILEITLRVDELVVRSPRPVALFQPESKAERALPRLCAELGAELGEGAVGTLCTNDTWIEEARTRLLPFGRPRPPERKRLSLASPDVEAVRLLVRPEPMRLEAPEVVLRTEGSAWWRSGDAAKPTVWLTAWLPERAARAKVKVVVGQEPIVVGWME